MFNQLTNRTSKFVALLTLAYLQAVFAGWSWGPCPDLQLQSPFTVDSYQGKWYEHARDKATWYQDGDCVQAKYTKENQNTVRVRNSSRKPGKSAPEIGRPGKAKCQNDGQCYVSFFWIDKNDYSVVSSDFTNYSVVKNCENWVFGLFRWEIYWILVRDPNAGTGVTDAAEAALASRSPHYDQSKNHQYTKRGGDCPYLD